eukprot:355617-Chlamydomonas_euryale.AAC.1
MSSRRFAINGAVPTAGAPAKPSASTPPTLSPSLRNAAESWHTASAALKLPALRAAAASSSSASAMPAPAARASTSAAFAAHTPAWPYVAWTASCARLAAANAASLRPSSTRQREEHHRASGSSGCVCSRSVAARSAAACAHPGSLPLPMPSVALLPAAACTRASSRCASAAATPVPCALSLISSSTSNMTPLAAASSACASCSRGAPGCTLLTKSSSSPASDSFPTDVYARADATAAAAGVSLPAGLLRGSAPPWPPSWRARLSRSWKPASCAVASANATRACAGITHTHVLPRWRAATSRNARASVPRGACSSHAAAPHSAALVAPALPLAASTADAGAPPRSRPSASWS